MGPENMGKPQTRNHRDYQWSSKNEGEKRTSHTPSRLHSLPLPYFLWGGDDIIGRIESQKASEGKEQAQDTINRINLQIPASNGMFSTT